MTEPYPAAQGYPTGDAVTRPTAPSSVVTAYRIYLAVAVVSVLGLIVALLNFGALRRAAVQGAGVNGTQLPSSTIDAIVIGSFVLGAVFGLIGAALYVLFAVFMRRGANWARIVLTVLSGLGILGGLAGLANTATTFGLNIVQLLLLIAGIVFLYLRPSNEYFRAARSARPLR